MKPRIFVSAVTTELQSSRQIVCNVLDRLGYEPVRQEIFGTEPGDLRQMLRRNIDDCVGVIQLVGIGYGAEPPNASEEFADRGFTRVSYTQFEFLYACARKKHTWLIFVEEGCDLTRPRCEIDLPRDPNHPDATSYQAERHTLQQAYRDHWKMDGHLRHSVSNTTELELKIERLKDEFAQLRKEFRSWQRNVNRYLAIVSAVTFVIGLGLWHNLAQQTNEVRRLADTVRDGTQDSGAQKVEWDLTQAPIYGEDATVPEEFANVPKPMHVAYEEVETDGVQTIAWQLPYRTALEKGKRVSGVDFGSTIFAWHYPNLSIKALNNTKVTVLITDAVIRVEKVEVDERPLIVVQDRSYNRIQFRNFGWGTVIDPVVAFSLLPIGAPLPSSPDYQYREIPITGFDGDLYVPLPRDLASPLLDAPELHVIGEFSCGRSDQKSSVAFNTCVLQEVRSGRPVQPTFQYSVKLDSSRKSNAPIHVAVSQAVESNGGTDQFLLRVASDRTARYWLSIELMSADKKSLGTRSIILDIFVPRFESEEQREPVPTLSR